MIKIVNKKVPIYPGKLVVVLSDDFDIVMDKYKLSRDGSFNTCYGLACNITGGYLVILTEHPSHNTIAHEALHITHMILDHVGVKADYSNDEADCYLLGWVIGEIYKGIEKYKITKEIIK